MNQSPEHEADHTSRLPEGSQRDLEVRAAWQSLLRLLAHEVARLLEKDESQTPMSNTNQAQK